MDDVDFSQRTAEETKELMAHPLMRDIKRIMPFHAMWSDPKQLWEFYEGLLDAMHNGSGRGARAAAKERQARQASDHEFLDDPERWNRQKQV